MGYGYYLGVSTFKANTGGGEGFKRGLGFLLFGLTQRSVWVPRIPSETGVHGSPRQLLRELFRDATSLEIRGEAPVLLAPLRQSISK